LITGALPPALIPLPLFRLDRTPAAGTFLALRAVRIPGTTLGVGGGFIIGQSFTGANPTVFRVASNGKTFKHILVIENISYSCTVSAHITPDETTKKFEKYGGADLTAMAAAALEMNCWSHGWFMNKNPEIDSHKDKHLDTYFLRECAIAMKMKRRRIMTDIQSRMSARPPKTIRIS
jgi:hypothetical protein